MLDLRTIKFKSVIDRYYPTVVEQISDPDTISSAESKLHTEYLHKCSRGDISARNYVKEKIQNIVEEIISEGDKKIISQLITEELNKFNNKIYEKYIIKNNDTKKEKIISYYQLCELSASLSQRQYIEDLTNGDINFVSVLSNEIYKKTYGSDLIDELLQMKINNIEVHDIHKIRVELSDGSWVTIKDYNFADSDDVKNVAVRLLSQDSGGDLTEEDCERESMLVDGSRITVALKPAAYCNYIFIKKFDSFDVSEEEMLKNGTVTQEMLDDLRILAKGRANSIIIGGVNTGKSTFAKVYCGLFPKHFKIGVIDSSKDTDLFALYPDRDIVTLYETAKYSLNDQFSRLLRANRNILIIAEARSYEIEQMIKAMTRANAGSFCTLHTTTAAMTINNIAYMCQESGIPQDMRVLRARISEAVDLVVRIRHFDTGERRVDEITEIVATGDLDSPFKTSKLYYWDRKKKQVIRNPEYKLSPELEEKLFYYGCSQEDIDLLNRC